MATPKGVAFILEFIMSEEKKTRMLKIVRIVFILGIVVCGVGLATVLLDRKKAADEYEELETYISIDEDATKEEPVSTEVEEKEPAVSEVPTEDEIKIEVSIDMDYASLKEINSDFTGWIYYKPLELSYPFVMDKGNEYYEHHSFENTSTSSGAIFMDYVCKRDMSGFNTILYGHNMRNGTMFGSLDKLLKDEEIIKGDPYFYVFTEKEKYMYKIVSVYYAKKTSKTYDLKLNWTLDEKNEYIDYMDSVSEYRDEDFFKSEITDEDRLCTLSTCHGINSDSRTVVHGVLVAREAVTE